MFAVGDSLHVIGGDVLDGSDYFATVDVEVYTPATDSWKMGTSLPFARASSAASRLLDGRILLAGGQTGLLGANPKDLLKLSTAVAWDPTTNLWTADDGPSK